MKKTMSLLLTIILVMSSFTLSSGAAEVVDTATGVTTQMCTASYWKTADMYQTDEVLMDAEQIKAVNQAAVDTAGTYVYDLEQIPEVTDASQTRTSLANNSIPTRSLYINGELIDNTTYFTNINNAILDTAYSDTEHEIEYAVAVTTVDMKSIPADDVIGYSTDDPDDEYALASLVINEPFVIKQMCVVDGKKWYWGYSTNCSGWVRAEDLAVCASKEEWTDAWKVSLEGDDFIVVTQDKITLEPSIICDYSSEVKLTLGSILKLVADKPENIGERGTWNNYVVYIPTRDADGNYMKKLALISQHYSVSVGFLPLTQGNLLDIAFSCLGNRYGWGGMLQSFDCSLYTRTIYRCFGFELPRNTTWQQLIPNTKVDLSQMTDEEKEKYIETLPVGSLLYFTGHTMMYVGTVDGVNYVISALGVASDSVGELNLQDWYSVTINPLTVRRGNGRTWLNNLTAAVVLAPAYDINDCEITATKACDADDADTAVVVTYRNKTLYAGINYTYTIENGSVTVEGMGTFTSSKTVDIDLTHTATTDSAVAATCTTTGLTEGSHCSTCGTVLTVQQTINKLPHTYSTTVYIATLTSNGKTVNTCTVCGHKTTTSVVYKPSNVSLSATSYTYDGKVKTPTVIVKDSKGNIVPASNYTVSYAKGRKTVGTYKVTVRFQGNYSGSQTLTFTINPKSTKISSITKQSKGFVIKWKKQALQTTGYQIRYSLKSNMSSSATYTVKGNGKTTQSITKLKANKKYYVQIRTYKTVNGKKYYSSWSSKTTVKTK